MSKFETPPLTSTYRGLKVVAITIILLAGTFSCWNPTVDAAGFSRSGRAGAFNGFDVGNAIVPKSELRSGGPPRDGIPAMLEPRFQPADNVPWLNDQDEVVGVEINGVAKAYPLRILIWHELVNDEVGGNAVLVTYCPLCGSAMVFERAIGRREMTFGVSGMLYQSDVLTHRGLIESMPVHITIQDGADDVKAEDASTNAPKTKPYLLVEPSSGRESEANYCFRPQPCFKTVLLERLAAPSTK